MFKNKPFICIVIMILCVNLIGCAALQRKFTRKKKKEEERVAPVITTYDYSKELRTDELYKKYFLFWKSWQTELIERMDATYKKRVTCYDYTVTSLLEMKKYLADSKAIELEQFINRIKSIDSDIRKKMLSKSEKYRIKQLLEKTKRHIDKEFSYSEVKDFLKSGR